jgi:DNA-directed RNA polymerase subunit RPC12/RpoP
MTEFTKDEIKLCPFCGSKVEMKNAVIYPNMERSPASIRCKKCNFFIADYGDDDLIQRWNNRPIEDALCAENERLKMALDNLITEAELAGDYRIDKEYIKDAKKALEVTK